MTDLPDVTAGEAMAKAHAVEQELTAAGQRVKDLREEKGRWRFIAEAKLEAQGLRSGVHVDESGDAYMYYQVEKPKFDIIEEDKVLEWAEGQDESYIDPSPSLRERLVFEECRRLHEEGLPLPPGVAVRTETEFHKKSVK